MKRTLSPPNPDMWNSPLYLLAILLSARKSRDHFLELDIRRRLTKLGVRVIFGDEISTREVQHESH